MAGLMDNLPLDSWGIHGIKRVRSIFRGMSLLECTPSVLEMVKEGLEERYDSLSQCDVSWGKEECGIVLDITRNDELPLKTEVEQEVAFKDFITEFRMVTDITG